MKLDLNILKMDEDKRISVLVYSKEDKVIRRHYLSNKNKYRQGYENTLTFDLKTDYKIVFSYKKLVSLPIQLSKSLPSLKVRINKRYKCDFFKLYIGYDDLYIDDILNLVPYDGGYIISSGKLRSGYTKIHTVKLWYKLDADDSKISEDIDYSIELVRE